jgi:hypothetical protein
MLAFSLSFHLLQLQKHILAVITELKQFVETRVQLENFALLPSDSDEDSDVPLAKRQRKKIASTNKNSESDIDSEEDDNDESFAEEQVKVHS